VQESEGITLKKPKHLIGTNNVINFPVSNDWEVSLAA